MSRLEDEVQQHGGWSAVNNPRIREFVAREVVDGGMSIAQLARDHGLPASRVRKWVDTYRKQGRSGLEALDDPTS